LTDLAVSSTDAPGKKVVYCSAAGNAGDNGYRHPFEAIPDSKVRATGGHGNLKLGEVNESLTGGGWHNWNPNPGPVEPSTDVTNLTDPTGQYQLFLQWDDAFDLDHGITTDFVGDIISGSFFSPNGPGTDIISRMALALLTRSIQ